MAQLLLPLVLLRLLLRLSLHLQLRLRLVLRRHLHPRVHLRLLTAVATVAMLAMVLTGLVTAVLQLQQLLWVACLRGSGVFGFKVTEGTELLAVAMAGLAKVLEREQLLQEWVSVLGWLALALPRPRSCIQAVMWTLLTRFSAVTPTTKIFSRTC